MLTWFRRRREARARLLIRAELEQLLEYEEGHVARQAIRLAAQSQTDEHRRPVRPHGEYDPDQKRQHVRIRVRQQMKRPPKALDQLLREEIPDEE